jgi:hypothetical protein
VHQARQSQADKREPHVFLPARAPRIAFMRVANASNGIGWAPPFGGARGFVCGICGRRPDDRLHVRGEASADAEAPNWG